MTYEQLAEHYGCSIHTIQNAVKRLGVEARKRGLPDGYEWTEERRAAHRTAIDRPEWKAKNRENLLKRRGVLRPLAARHYASNRGHHPHLPAGMHHASPLLVTDLHWQSAHRDQTLSQPAEARLFVLRYDHRQPGRRFPSDELRTTS